MAIRLSGLASGMDTESMVAELMKAERQKTTKLNNKITTLEWKQEKWQTLNSKIYKFYTDSLSKMRLQGNYNTKGVTVSDSSKVAVTADTNAAVGTHTLKIKQLASSQYVTGDVVAADKNGKAIGRSTLLTDLGFSDTDSNIITIKGGIKEVLLGVDSSTTVGSFIDACKSAGINANYDATQKRFFLSSTDSGAANAFTMTSTSIDSLSNLGLADITTSIVDDELVVDAGGLSIVQPKDAVVEYNGAKLTSKNNTITANGLTFNLKGATEDQTLNLVVAKDTDAVYNMVKSFITGYNELLKEMNETYGAASAKGYDPLTDEQKEAMTDTQIENWESKIKTSLLRRDDSLNSVINSLRTGLGKSVTVNGKSYSLSTFGINTGAYTEKGLLHINGNSEDSTVAGTADKLKKALTEDPETTITALTTIMNDLYTDLSDKMKSSTIKSALNFYNDKEMTSKLREYNTSLKSMESKLSTLESKYYKQFTAMESAMSKMNSQSSSFLSMLGQS
ncbi:MAG: flagellar filament capping protein FliD [Mobilitalea sp.]